MSAGNSNLREAEPDGSSRPLFVDFSEPSEPDEHEGDYSARMEELLSDEEEDAEDDDEEEAFVYNGVDAPEVPTAYRDRLRDVLEHEATDDEETDIHEVERSLIVEEGSEKFAFEVDEPLVCFCTMFATNFLF